MQNPHHHEYFKRVLRPPLYIAPTVKHRVHRRLPVILPCLHCTLIPEVLSPPHVLADVLPSVIVSYRGVATLCNYILEEVPYKLLQSAGRGGQRRRAAAQRYGADFHTLTS